jgi:uncharacterized membrane protein
MYKLIGGDQKEYGPATPDEIRHWIAEGRLNGHSWIRLEPSTEWKPLATFPEFADALRAQTAGGQIPPSIPALPLSPQAFASETLAGRPPRVEIGGCLSRSFNLLKGSFGLFYGAAFIVFAISLAAWVSPLGLGLIPYFVLKGAFYGGVYLLVLKRVRGEPASIANTFAGFTTSPVQLMLAGVITGIITWILMQPCCLILPGVYFLIAWTFAIPLIVDRRLEFWSAMELSRKVVTRVWFEMLGLALLAFLPYVIAWVVVQTQIGLSFMPFIREVMAGGHVEPAEIIRKMSEFSAQAEKQARPGQFILKVVWFLNWPFAVGALMYAYEGLFGSRRSQGP